MMRYLFLFLCVVFAACGKSDSFTEDLSDGWQFLCRGEWYPATVPGCIHTDLMSEGLIPDPFYATNEDSVQWVSDSVWTYRRTLAVESRHKGVRHLELVFDGLDTYAEIAVNGNVLARTDNMFRQWRVPIEDILLLESADGDISELTVTVRFFPTKPHDDSCAAALGYGVPDRRVFSRTAPYQQGWDWGPRLNTCGIWQSVRLEGWSGAGNPFDWERKPDRDTKLFRDFPYHNVRLVQEEEVADDTAGAHTARSFRFEADGKPIFAKGANWIPAHSFPVLDKAQKERYRHLLCSAKEAHFNMIRVWGGGIYEPDFFYDLCDSLGIMVWQDFDYSCAFYPGDSAFLENARLEAEYQVRRLARHPCIVLWCGNNEVWNGWEDWGWQRQYGYTAAQIRQIAHDIDTLFGIGGILDRTVRKYAPWVSYHPSSPAFGWGHPECVTHGDSHYWGVWWGEQPFEMYRARTGRFMSEYGFQSYPPMSTVETYCPADQRHIGSPAMASHQKHGRGVEIVDKAMWRYYGTNSHNLPLEDFVYMSQLVQAYGMGMGIESHLRHKGHCAGTLYWQLNDCWPVASWSSIDYYGNWKAAHYRVRDLFAPVAVLTEPVGATASETEVVTGPGLPDKGVTIVLASRKVAVAVVSDGEQPEGRLELRLRDFDGKVLQQSSVAVPRITPESPVCLKDYVLPAKYDPAACYLELTYGGVRKVHYFVYPKDLKLGAPVIGQQVDVGSGVCTVTLTTNTLAKDVMLTPEPYVPGHFSDNYFDLLPGETKTVTFVPKDRVGGRISFAVKTYNTVSAPWIPTSMQSTIK